MDGGFIDNLPKAEPPVLFVRVQGGLAKYLRQLSACGPPLHVHLPETIACGNIALREIEIVVIGCLNVRNASLVTSNSDASMQTRDCHSVGRLLSGCAKEVKAVWREAQNGRHGHQHDFR